MPRPDPPISKLFPLRSAKFQRCCDCFGFKPASVLQIITGSDRTRNRYFCVDCAKKRKLPQSERLMKALSRAQLHKAKAIAAYEQSQSEQGQQRKAKAGRKR